LFHQTVVSSKSFFIKELFHQTVDSSTVVSSNSCFIKQLFNQKVVSSNSCFIKQLFNQKVVSSNSCFIKPFSKPFFFKTNEREFFILDLFLGLCKKARRVFPEFGHPETRKT
jgi:hypothetical protein